MTATWLVTAMISKRCGVLVDLAPRSLNGLSALYGHRDAWISTDRSSKWGKPCPSRLRDFADESALERALLDDIAPAMPPATGLQIVDYRDAASTGPSIHARVGAGAVHVQAHVGKRPVHVDIAAYAFGAAWKIVDLIIEQGTPGQIQNKVHAALSQKGSDAPSPIPLDLWRGLTRLYAVTADLRHTIVHRKVIVHPNGDLEATLDRPHPVPGPEATRMTASECQYFLRIVQGASNALVTQGLSARDEAHLCFLLNQFDSRYGLEITPGQEITRHVLILAQPHPLPGRL